MILCLIFILFQNPTPAKPSRDFEISTNYALKKKPLEEDHPRIVYDKPEATGSNTLLPYLSLTLKVKRWHADATHVRVADMNGKQYFKKKKVEEGEYNWDVGYIDDIKDKVKPGDFLVTFLDGKTPLEQIKIEIQTDGTFLVNGEKRGKF